MAQHMRVVSLDLEEILANIKFEGLDQAQRERVSALGLPGAKDLFNENPARAREAAREFAANFIGTEDEGEQT